MKKTPRSFVALVGLSLITSCQALGSGGTVQNEDPREELSARSDELLDALAVAQKPASSEEWTVENWEYGIFPAPCTNDRGDKYQLTARRSFEGESSNSVRHDLQTRIWRELQEAGFTVDDALEAEFGNTVIANNEHVKVTVVLRPSGRYEVDGEYMCAPGPYFALTEWMRNTGAFEESKNVTKLAPDERPHHEFLDLSAPLPEGL